MLTEDKRGWWWSVSIYDYLHRVNRTHNSKKPFLTYDEAFNDLVSFLERMRDEEKQATEDSELATP